MGKAGFDRLAFLCGMQRDAAQLRVEQYLASLHRATPCAVGSLFQVAAEKPLGRNLGPVQTDPQSGRGAEPARWVRAGVAQGIQRDKKHIAAQRSRHRALGHACGDSGVGGGPVDQWQVPPQQVAGNLQELRVIRITTQINMSLILQDKNIDAWNRSSGSGSPN